MREGRAYAERVPYRYVPGQVLQVWASWTYGVELSKAQRPKQRHFRRLKPKAGNKGSPRKTTKGKGGGKGKKGKLNEIGEAEEGEEPEQEWAEEEQAEEEWPEGLVRFQVF